MTDPMRLAHTDWLYHRLAVAGPADTIAAFRAAAAGAGTIPWQLDFDRVAEDAFHVLIAPAAPQPRTLSAVGARVLAEQLGTAVARRHALAVARVGHSRACPFDLHSLVPVPSDVLALGPDDPASLDWLWAHWGTTEPLRHVATAAPEATAGGATLIVNFWAADWTPWRAMADIKKDWAALSFDIQPAYEP